MQLSSSPMLHGSSHLHQSTVIPSRPRVTIALPASPHRPLSRWSRAQGLRVSAARTQSTAAEGAGDNGGQENVRLNRPYNEEEKQMLRKALASLRKDCAARGVDFTYMAVYNKFVELTGNQTTRQYIGVTVQIKALDREDAQAAQGIPRPEQKRGYLGPKEAPDVTIAQMVGEVMSTMPGMQATRDEVLAVLGDHPIYCHLLNWDPAKGSKSSTIAHSWQYTCDKAIAGKKMFKKSQMMLEDFRKVYIFDPTCPHRLDNLWRGMPWVLASLLATYLAKLDKDGCRLEPACCTATELTAALLQHPMYRAVLVQQDGGREDRLSVNRFVNRVEAALEQHVGELFEKQGSRYTAIIHPLVPKQPIVV